MFKRQTNPSRLEKYTPVARVVSLLWDKKIGSEIQYLQAKNNKESLEKKLATVKEQYDLTKLYAPINGTVDEVTIKEGEAAAAGMGAIRIVQLSELSIRAKISENYITQIKVGDTVQVYFPVIDLKLTKKIKAVSQVIDPQNRTFEVEIKITEIAQAIKPNMLAVLTINNYTNPKALTVPLNIVQKTGDNFFLFVAKEEPDSKGTRWLAERRTVVPGEHQGDRFEIVKGLKAGEQVVVFGYQDLADGQTLMLASNKPSA